MQSAGNLQVNTVATGAGHHGAQVGGIGLLGYIAIGNGKPYSGYIILKIRKAYERHIISGPFEQGSVIPLLIHFYLILHLSHQHFLF